MVLYIHSNTSYNSEQKSRSHVSCHFYLSDTPVDPLKPSVNQPSCNSAIHTISISILKNIMLPKPNSPDCSTMLTMVPHYAQHLLKWLVEMGHLQPPATPIQTYNSTTMGITNGTV
jgi:hypothetical protein